MKTVKLIQSLREELIEQASTLDKLEGMSLDQLSKKPGENKWNALECIAHLNSYARYYLPSFNKAVKEAEEKGWKAEDAYKSSWLGRFSIKSVSPETRKRKLPAPKQHNHRNSLLTKDEILRLQNHLEGLHSLLNRAEKVNLKKVKVKIEIASFFKLPLGDFIPFLVRHQSRHLAQALEAATHSVAQEVAVAQS